MEIGDRMPARVYGPLTVMDTVRSAGFQENWTPLHYDRDGVRDHARLPTFIVSGEYRQALLLRSLVRWAWPRGAIARFRIRHTAPTHEGEMMRFASEVVKVVNTGGGRLVDCTIEGRNQTEKQIMAGDARSDFPL